jgi:secreted trypsin-like serine protease
MLEPLRRPIYERWLAGARLVAALVIAMLGGCAAELDAVGVRETPILDGTIDEGSPAVVALTSRIGVPYCTATLIGPRTLLTAAHCVHEVTPAHVYFGTDPTRNGVFVAVVEVREHPNYDPTGLGVNDLGIVVLARPAPIAPIALMRTAPEPGGDELLFVGFGFAEPAQVSQLGIKRAAASSITDVEPTVIRYDKVTCQGDSGGPALAYVDDTYYLVGVTSFGDPRCEEFGASMRVDAYLAWIEQQLGEAANCELDQRCRLGCVPVDLDCGDAARVKDSSP